MCLAQGVVDMTDIASAAVAKLLLACTHYF
jgi:hypothetical protein